MMFNWFKPKDKPKSPNDERITEVRIDLIEIKDMVHRLPHTQGIIRERELAELNAKVADVNFKIFELNKDYIYYPNR